MTRRQRAIAYIEECRDIHAHWIVLQDQGKLDRDDVRIGGGKTWHKKWVQRYDAVLRELKTSST